MDESSITQNRRSRRSPVLLSATIWFGGVPVAVKLRNLSEQGALVEGDRLPPEGAETFFERKEMKLRSRIVWVEGKYAGVAFDVPLKREDVLRHIPQPKAKSFSESDYRRPGFACRPLTQYERQNLERWLATAPLGHLGD
nr:PilZ domain-containing protein [Sphingomonas sp.]